MTQSSQGFAVVNGDTVAGFVIVNQDAGTILIQQEEVNLMFYRNISRIHLKLNEEKIFETMHIDEKPILAERIVDGKRPLYEYDKSLYTIQSGFAFQIVEEKDLYQFFNRKDVKNLIFVRAFDFSKREDVISIFEILNN
ncbi:MAG: hypothetical protein AAF789_06965 [Bacteroidota bacterium]